jgi:hypothetical protein
MPGSQGMSFSFEQSPLTSCGQPHEPDINDTFMNGVKWMTKLQIKLQADKISLDIYPVGMRNIRLLWIAAVSSGSLQSLNMA